MNLLYACVFRWREIIVNSYGNSDEFALGSYSLTENCHSDLLCNVTSQDGFNDIFPSYLGIIVNFHCNIPLYVHRKMIIKIMKREKPYEI